MKSTVKKVVFVTIGVVLMLPVCIPLMLRTFGVHVPDDQIGTAFILSFIATLYFSVITFIVGVFDE